MQANAPVTLTHVAPRVDEDAALRPLDFAIIRRLWAWTRPHARKRNVLTTLVLIRAAQLPFLAWTLGAVINGPIAQHDLWGVVQGGAGFAALALFTQLTFSYRIRLALEFGDAIISDLRLAIFTHLHELTMSFYNKTKLGRILGRATSDLDALRVGVQDVLFMGLVQVGQMLVSAALMLYHDWALFLVVAALGPVLWFLNDRFRTQLGRAHQQAHESFSRITATLAESVHGIRVTQGFVRQDRNAELFHDLAQDHSNFVMSAARTSAVFIPLLELNNQLFIATLLLLGGYRVLTPSIHRGMGDLIQFFFLANLFFQPMQTIGTLYNQALTAMAGAERVLGLLDTPPDWTEPAGARPIGRIEGRVEFRRLSFEYEPGRPVLQDIDFLAEPGQTIALVGHTGSGKSSMINLLAKFYLPTAGELRIDGRDIREIETSSLHRQMGMVQQQNFLFGGTVGDNIRVGRPHATHAEVMEAARQLDLADLIDQMRDGLHTRVGEHGAGLSLGQRQLVCFTRAMLADPRILLLDEATSSVDAMTEARLQKALAQLLRGRTSFVVAHRLSTIRHADLVLVIDAGRILERGRHDELIAAGGAYEKLYRQFVRATEA